MADESGEGEAAAARVGSRLGVTTLILWSFVKGI
jgi:hypothetical protein